MINKKSALKTKQKQEVGPTKVFQRRRRKNMDKIYYLYINNPPKKPRTDRKEEKSHKIKSIKIGLRSD